MPYGNCDRECPHTKRIAIVDRLLGVVAEQGGIGAMHMEIVSSQYHQQHA